MQLVQVDDAIPKGYQDQLAAETSGLGWFFQPERARPGLSFTREFSGFSHPAFDASAPTPVTSHMSALLVPLLFVACEKAGLEMNGLLRIRLGMFPRTLIDVPHHNPHVDLYEPHVVGLYHVDDSDGDTVIFQETFEDLTLEQSVRHANLGRFTEAARVSPKKGRMAFFDGKHYHASMHPKAHAARRVVTFDFR
jgi:hypothetical protein